MTLTEFLEARIAEDEEAARWTTEAPWQVVSGEVLSSVSALNVASHCEGAYRMLPKDAAHIARWDPYRVWAECEAKVQIVARYKGSEDALNAQPDPLKRMAAELIVVTLLDVLKALALPYADHPDYLPEWRP